jgi:acyl-CoA synthetase (AMP-forming)/AMP-acid ligase II
MSNPAIIFEAKILTYRELDDLSDIGASSIIELGIKPGDVVLVNLKRSKETVPILIALLKAGVVYCPVNPAYPSDRLNYVLLVSSFKCH